MTPPSRPRRKRLAVVNLVIAPVVAGLLLLPIVQRPALASPTLQPPGRPSTVNFHLNLDNASATRALAQEGAAPEGAAQESDGDMPKTVQPKKEADSGNAAAIKKEKAPEDPFAFVKDWPFWVIVGGVVLVGAAGYMLLRNSNDTGPCNAAFDAGCFGVR